MRTRHARTPARHLGRALILLAVIAAVATPVALARDHAFLGISSRNVSGSDARRLDLDRRDGAIITTVYDGTAADEAGLRRGDIIVKFGGERVFDDEDLGEMIRDHGVGEKVTIEIIRRGERKTLEATLGSHDEWNEDRHHGGVSVFTDHDGGYSYSFGNWRRPTLGVHIMELNSQLAEYFGVEDQRGVLVTRVVRRSPAEEGGIQAGDVIVRVAGDRIVRSGDISDAIEGLWGETVDVEVVRKGSRRTVQVGLDDRDDD